MFYEVLAAFFLEAGFLGIMLFGLKKVGPRLHFFATCAVAIGSLISAFWILSANSWMQTPAGYSIGIDGRFVAEDWWAIIFNPSFPYRLAHMTLATLLGSATLVAGVSAWQLLRAPENPRARLAYSMALWVVVLLTPVQILVGIFMVSTALKFSRKRSPPSKAPGVARWKLQGSRYACSPFQTWLSDATIGKWRFRA